MLQSRLIPDSLELSSIRNFDLKHLTWTIIIQITQLTDCHARISQDPLDHQHIRYSISHVNIRQS